MIYASPRARIAAFWLDALVITTYFFVAARLIWSVLPGSEVKEGMMQLYTPKQFFAFLANGAAGVVFLTSYFTWIPAKLGATPGQRLAHIKAVNADGGPLTKRQRADRLAMLMFQALSVIFGGPALASVGGNFALSMIGLAAPIIGMIVLSGMAWADPEGAGPRERASGYRWIATD